MRRGTSVGGLAFLAAVSLTSGLGGCGSSGEQTLIMGTSPDYPPYEFYGVVDGQEQIIGFDVDIANRIAEELGVELQIEAMEFNDLIPAVAAGRVDFVMAGMTPTEERQQQADFSDLYFQATNTIIAKQESGITTPADLEGKQVAVQTGSTQEGDAEDLAESIPDVQILSLPTLGEVIQQVKSDQVDAAVVEDTVAKGFAASNPELVFTPIVTEGPSGSAVAFPKGSERVEDFNRILAEMKQSGETEQLVIKWFGDTSPALQP